MGEFGFESDSNTKCPIKLFMKHFCFWININRKLRGLVYFHQNLLKASKTKEIAQRWRWFPNPLKINFIKIKKLKFSKTNQENSCDFSKLRTCSVLGKSLSGVINWKTKNSRIVAQYWNLRHSRPLLKFLFKNLQTFLWERFVITRTHKAHSFIFTRFWRISDDKISQENHFFSSHFSQFSPFIFSYLSFPLLRLKRHAKSSKIQQNEWIAFLVRQIWLRFMGSTSDQRKMPKASWNLVKRPRKQRNWVRKYPKLKLSGIMMMKEGLFEFQFVFSWF